MKAKTTIYIVRLPNYPQLEACIFLQGYNTHNHSIRQPTPPLKNGKEREINALGVSEASNEEKDRKGLG